MADPQSMLYRQAKAIVHLALDLPEAERVAFIETHCEQDEALFREACWLLGTLEEDDRFLEQNPLQQVEPDADEIVHIKTPRDYRIIQRLGEGGHGVVFMAERSDGKYRQLVALKLLNFAGQLSPSATARFLAERQILAQLNHPNIAHLIDAGTLPDGRPFLAMEFVDGIPITEYCNTHKLDVRQRIQLFSKVCAAVGYAHQQLVIHRDLKPANILVTRVGEPKLLDFGIARLLKAQDDIAIPPTEHGQRLLTLVYASPEQIRSEPLSTTSDIYSLGVLLYELLSGTLPFSNERDDSVQLTRAICETEPQRPSRRTGQNTSGATISTGPLRESTTRQWLTGRHQVSADLDAITLKALRKRPEDRYDSVYSLIADLNRYLSERPVLARKGRLSYRMRRYLQRNRWGVAAATVFVVLIVGFAANRQFELERTQLERDKAQQLADFMSDLFENADPSQSRGETVTVREMLDRGAREVPARTGIDPRLKASMLISIGRAYIGLGLPAEAVTQLSSALTLYETSGASAKERVDVLMLLGEAYSAAGDYGKAIAQQDSAARLLQATAEDDDETLARMRLARTTNRVLLADTPLEPLIAELNTVVRDLEARPAPSDELLLDAYDSLGKAYIANGKNELAAAALSRAAEISTRLLGANAPRTLSARSVHAQAVVGVDPAKAVSLFEGLINDYGRVVGDRNITYANHLNDLAVAYAQQGDHARSVATLYRARDIARKVVGPTDRYFLQLTGNLASNLNVLGRQDEAAELIREILPVLSTRVETGIDRLVYAHALNQLGRALQDRDDLEAERAFLQAEQVLGPDGPDGYFTVYIQTLYGLSEVRMKLHRYREAAISLQRVKEVEKKTGSPGLKSRILEVDLMLAERRYQDAAKLSAEGFAIASRLRGQCHASTKRLREQYITAVEGLGNPDGTADLPECKQGARIDKMTQVTVITKMSVSTFRTPSYSAVRWRIVGALPKDDGPLPDPIFTHAMSLSNKPDDITQMIIDSRSGDDEEFARLFAVVYTSLKNVARNRLSEEYGHVTLSTTALINEAYLKLMAGERPTIKNRSHLLGVLSNAMRQVLVDYARRRNAAKRPQNANRIAITEVELAMDVPIDIEALDSALTRLAEVDDQQAKVVELKFFGGMTLEDIATTLEISTATVTREWRMARAWLRRELEA